MTKSTQQAQIDEFIALAEGQWKSINDGDSSSGNKKAKQIDKIVTLWGHDGDASRILNLLVEHASPSVRLASASHLINYGGSDVAASVLQDLSRSEVGMISVFADTVLRVRNLTSKHS